MPETHVRPMELSHDSPKLVASVRARKVLPCVHCDRELAIGNWIFKWAPGCCPTHTLDQLTTDSGQGRGSWVCAWCQGTLHVSYNGEASS